jgi:6-pyruvoyl-tetrahydropterin synthase related domain
MDQFYRANVARDPRVDLTRSLGFVRFDRRSAIYVFCLATLAIYFLIWPIWRAQFPLEIWVTEGWNAYLQDAAASGGHLYPAPNDLIGNNYPPLSFYAIGLLGKIFGDSLYVGRALSIIALLCVAGEIFLCARILTRTIIGPAIGALWYLAIMSHHSAAYVGVNDPQIAGESIMGAALVLFLRRDSEDRSIIPALLLMVVAGFWKHNMIGIPLTAVTWLLLRDHKKAFRPISVSAGAAVAGLLLCRLLFGSDFLPDLLAPRAYGWGGILANIGHLQWCAAALVTWAIWAISSPVSMPARFTTLHVSISFGSCILQWSGEGVSGNAEFDLILALGIATCVAFAGVEKSWFARYVRSNYLRDIGMAILLLRLIGTDRQETALLLLSPDVKSYFYAGEREVAKESAEISSMRGRVFCSNDIVCRLAGKAFVVDDFKIEEMVSTGINTEAQIAALLKIRRIAFFKNADATRASPNTSISTLWR